MINFRHKDLWMVHAAGAGDEVLDLFLMLIVDMEPGWTGRQFRWWEESGHLSQFFLSQRVKQKYIFF